MSGSELSNEYTAVNETKILSSWSLHSTGGDAINTINNKMYRPDGGLSVGEGARGCWDKL